MSGAQRGANGSGRPACGPSLVHQSQTSLATPPLRLPREPAARLASTLLREFSSDAAHRSALLRDYKWSKQLVSSSSSDLVISTIFECDYFFGSLIKVYKCRATRLVGFSVFWFWFWFCCGYGFKCGARVAVNHFFGYCISNRYLPFLASRFYISCVSDFITFM